MHRRDGLSGVQGRSWGERGGSCYRVLARDARGRVAKLTSRQTLVIVHDVAATAVATVASFWLRFDTQGLEERLDALLLLLPGFLLYAAGVYRFFTSTRESGDSPRCPISTTSSARSRVLAVSLLVLDYILVAPNFLGTFFFGKITIVLYWLLQMFFLAVRASPIAISAIRARASMRMAAESAPILVLGRAADAEVLLRAIESGAVKKIWPVGILSPSPADQGQSIRGIPVLRHARRSRAVVDDFAARGTPVARIVLTPSALEPDAKPETILMQARRLGLATSRLPSLDEGGEALRLAPVERRGPAAAPEREDRLPAA